MTDFGRRQVWAVYGQVNVPIVGDDNKFLFVDRLNVEASARYDRYNTFGGTFNPKVSADWGIYDGFCNAWLMGNVVPRTVLRRIR